MEYTVENYGDLYFQRQDLFESQISLSPVAVSMLFDIEKIWSKNINDIKNVGFTETYYNDIKKLSLDYGVEYVTPEFRTGLKVVSSPVTVASLH